MHPLITQMIWRLYANITDLKWPVFWSMFVFHALVTWAGFTLTNEDHLTDPINFVYYYMTTASTIGYGDLSPQSPPGRLFAAFWLFPGALILFTTFLAKLTSTATTTWRKRMDGFGDYSDVVGATIMVGYHPVRTKRMIAEIFAGESDYHKLILVSRFDVNIDKDKVLFVKAEKLSDKNDLIRAGVLNAKKVIVYADEDDVTLAASMAVSALNPNCHLVAYFSDESNAELLRAHTNASCVVSQSVEMVVREMQDPGAAQVLTDLSSARTNVTVFSIDLPSDFVISFENLAQSLRGKHATLLGVKCKQTNKPLFNLSPAELMNGYTVFYIAEDRMNISDILHGLQITKDNRTQMQSA